MRDLVPDHNVGFVGEDRPQRGFELVDRQVSKARYTAALAREVRQPQDHADQEKRQKRDGSEHCVESNSRRPGHGVVLFHHPRGAGGTEFAFHLEQLCVGSERAFRPSAGWTRRKGMKAPAKEKN